MLAGLSGGISPIRNEELGIFVGGGGFVSGLVGVGERGFCPLFDGWGCVRVAVGYMVGL